ncbi:hypothetical protein L2E82_25528 [Cichorium intybus]|uniref:Uncharacterized protein n=1 Tax=Cichorium intybus TaxID=13427 RepID=A0ACB9E3C4_CICIN|nr:hypothetical protein L2E82_25528 [Cichorium intybus]
MYKHSSNGCNRYANRRLLSQIITVLTCTFCIKSLAFEGLSLGSLPPIIQGIKVHELNENHLVFDLMAK